MDLFDFFGEYENWAQKADILFKKIAHDFPECVRCRVHCCDCCYAPFGVFIIEGAYLNYHFNRLDTRRKKEILRRIEKTEADLLAARDRLHVFDDNPKMKVFGLGKQRVRCPFLNDRDECDLYDKRPIICRIYGVPFSIKDEAHVCGLSNFKKGVTYPVVKLDKIYDELRRLSEDLLIWARSPHPERSLLMLPIARAIRLPLDDLIKGMLE
ncbi:MAG: YkgJ family cysteine cluster protein [Candidatus Desulfofervidaceae bacterium]|nr:YkgJ family cysteine cluster protein [Candidatus Desulfofervidaceae bacterium]